MRKFISNFGLAMAAVLLSAPVFVACDRDDDLKSYNLVISFAPSSELAGAQITDAKLILANVNGADTISVANINEPITVEKVQGSYTATFSARLADEAQAVVSGSTSVELYADQAAVIDLVKGLKSSLIFKTIYSTGGAQFYVLDSYIEIVNNSDEVQYLDNLILFKGGGNLKAQSAWQEAFPDLYASGQGAVLAFPGNGHDYPLQPGEFIVVADQAQNHKLAYDPEAEDADELAEQYAKSPDLSDADWEKYYGNGDTDNEAVPNLKTIFQNNQYMKMWAFGVSGGAYILAKLPDGVSVDDYAADENNYSVTPGTESTMQYLLISNKYVLDAVDAYGQGVAAEENYPFFLPKDDVKGIPVSPMYTGQAIRRKVERIENGRVYYQDTNNSSADWKTEQENTPRLVPTTVG